MTNIVSALQQVEAFKSLSKQSLKQLSERIHIGEYEAEEVIIRRGDPGDCMFVIASGSVKIPLLDEEGKQIMLAELGTGQCFGEMALLTGESRSADVVSATKSTCLVIPRNDFYSLVKTHPQVAVFLTELLGERLMNVNGIRQVGKYKLIGVLGEGGIAVVYEGVHPGLGRAVAIKMLSHTQVYHPHFADRFRNEAKIIAQLRHPNIVEVYDTEEAYATFFIIMEKLKGRDLEVALDKGRKFTPDEVRSVLFQMASALDYAHNKGVVHRDVKPSNIFLSAEGQVKLTDFGIALVPDMERELFVSERQALGSPLYMSPEQAMAKTIDGRTDIYAMGILAYEMLTGFPPFDDDDPRQVLRMHVRKPMPSVRMRCPSVPDDLELFINKSTAKSPDDRFQSASEIIDFFEGGTELLHQLSVQTLSFVYKDAQKGEVDDLVDAVKQMAAGIEGIIVR
jgi:serine/threonine protein kinase